MRNSSTGYHVASAAILTAFLLANILGVLPGIGLAQTDLAASRTALDILDKNCFSCHGAIQMSGLDIRQRETLLKGGKRGPAIIPGNPEGSLLYKAVAHQGDLKMPLGSGSPLPREQLEILKKWIKDGAPWPTNYAVAKRSEPAGWSFKKPQRPAVPHAKQGKPVANPIDAFVLARLEEKGLRTAPPADKLTLVRRAYFDW